MLNLTLHGVDNDKGLLLIKGAVPARPAAWSWCAARSRPRSARVDREAGAR